MRLQKHYFPVVAALIAGCAAAGVTALIPIEVMENFTASSGLSEIIPQTAPPLGATARLAIAFTFAVVAAAIVLALMGGTARTEAEAKDSDRMSDAPTRAPSMRMPRFGGVSRSTVFADSETIEASGGDDAENWFTRVKRRLDALAGRDERGIRDFDDLPKLRSADRHPDAPPRRPIFASADLDDGDEAFPAMATPEDSPPEELPAEETFPARPVPAAAIKEEQHWRRLGAAAAAEPEEHDVSADDPASEDKPSHPYADLDIDVLVDRLGRRLRASPVSASPIGDAQAETMMDEEPADAAEAAAEPESMDISASEIANDLPPLSPRPVQAVAPAQPAEPMDDMDAALQAALETLERMNRRSA